MRLSASKGVIVARLGKERDSAMEVQFDDRAKYLDGLILAVKENTLTEQQLRMVRSICSGVSGCGFNPAALLAAFVRRSETYRFPKIMLCVDGEHWVMQYTPKDSRSADEKNRGSVVLQNTAPFGSVDHAFGGRINAAGYFDRGVNYSAELDSMICALDPMNMPWADVARRKEATDSSRWYVKPAPAPKAPAKRSRSGK